MKPESFQPGRETKSNPLPRLKFVLPLVLLSIVAAGLLLFPSWRRTEQAGRSDAGKHELGRDSLTEARGTGLTPSPARTPVRPRITAPATETPSGDRDGAISTAPPATQNGTVTSGFPHGRGGTLAIDKTRTARRDLAGFGTELRGTVRLQGNPPPEKPLPLDPTCRPIAGEPARTRFYVVNSEGGLADVFLWLSEGVESFAPATNAQPALLDQVRCEYVPYVLGLQTGQTLLVRNSDPLMHNVHATPTALGNREQNRAQPARSRDLAFRFDSPEVFLRFKCDVHPWMFAYVGVVEHPFYSVTDENGSYAIRDIPPGTYRLEAYHRKAGRLSRILTIGDEPPDATDFTFDVPAGLSAP